jgi:hypothetical protein
MVWYGTIPGYGSIPPPYVCTTIPYPTIPYHTIPHHHQPLHTRYGMVVWYGTIHMYVCTLCMVVGATHLSCVRFPPESHHTQKKNKASHFQFPLFHHILVVVQNTHTTVFDAAEPITLSTLHQEILSRTRLTYHR